MSFERHLEWNHRLTPDDVEITDAPGYWQRKTPCGGRSGGCRAQIHQTMFNEGPMYHTIRYTDPVRNEHGRFTSPYRTWNKHRMAMVKGEAADD